MDDVGNDIPASDTRRLPGTTSTMHYCNAERERGPITKAFVKGLHEKLPNVPIISTVDYNIYGARIAYCFAARPDSQSKWFTEDVSVPVTLVNLPRPSIAVKEGWISPTDCSIMKESEVRAAEKALNRVKIQPQMESFRYTIKTDEKVTTLLIDASSLTC
eukprot:Selendium_serpulae@DN6268_c0_g1_i4.p1